MGKKFYITTPLYYVNDNPHIGHAYTTIAADTLARYYRQKGKEVFFLTGTDEHGSKIALAAESAGINPKEWSDRIVENFRNLWKLLNISFDDFIRTTEERHRITVQKIFSDLYKKGEIYKGVYEGWYCIPCETYCTETEIKGCFVCPECGRELKKIKEDSFFFKLSNYTEKLLEHYKKNPQFLKPDFRANEIINFVKGGLRDLSVTRKNVKWGIPIPCETEKCEDVIYVWFDALINYITVAGYGKSEFENLWPADIHFVGKEIFRFHTVIWPAMLLAEGIPLPKKVFAHGWWTVDGKKMSKSKGNIADPKKIISEFGVDALRYFLLREVPFGQDGNFSLARFKERYNADLADDLGNLLNRTTTMIEREKNLNFSIKDIKDIEKLEKTNQKFQQLLKMTDRKFENFMEECQFSLALDSVWELVSASNKYVEDSAPWKYINKEPEKLSVILKELIYAIYKIAEKLEPFLPGTSSEIKNQLIKKGKPLFPKIK